jgi:hypothetical protein
MLALLLDPASAYAKWDFWLKVAAGLTIVPTLVFAWWTHRQKSTFEMIDKLYSLCHILQNHMLHEWRLSHLFCIGSDIYEQTVQQIGSGSLHERVKAKLGVEERQFAIHIFVIYEQVFYQQLNSNRWLEKGRERFLADMVSYFTTRLLLNPRLMAFFASDPTGRTLHLEPAAAENLCIYLRDKSIEIDSKGPFDVVLPVASNVPFRTVDISGRRVV